MLISITQKDLEGALVQLRDGDNTLGFVPTMGALHEGHLSLVKTALEGCDVCVTSIFVNPSQFSEPADLARYPRSLENDLKLLEAEGCHIAFTPEADEVYPNGIEAAPTYEFGRLDQVLEGSVRPGHFKGVAQVVARLLEMVQPDRLFLGQKDYQQFIVLKRLVEEILKRSVEIVSCPIVREEDGLAVSSRNVLLSSEQRRDAVALSQTLFWINEQQRGIQPIELKLLATEKLKAIPSIIEVDYVEIANAETLESINEWGSSKAIALAAIRMEGVRLIDNVMLRFHDLVIS